MMTFVHGSKNIITAVALVLISISILGGFILTEKKLELNTNKKEWELVSEKMKEKNMAIIKEIEL